MLLAFIVTVEDVFSGINLKRYCELLLFANFVKHFQFPQGLRKLSYGGGRRGKSSGEGGGGGLIKNVGQHGWATMTKNFETTLVKFGP